MTQLPPPPPPPPPPPTEGPPPPPTEGPPSVPGPPPPPPPPPQPLAAPARWRDVRGLSVALVALFGVMVCAAVVLSVALANRISVVQDFQGGNFGGDVIGRANDADDFVSGASGFYGITQLVIVVLFIVWQFRVAKNNEALERRGPRFGPGWSIGAWFIPLANLVIPVMIMQDLWRGANPTTPRGDPGWRRAKGSWLIGVWWAAWLLSLLRFGASNAALHDSGSLDDIEASNIVALVGVVATVVAAVLAAFVVWTLSRRQLDALRAQRSTYEGTIGTDPALGTAPLA